MDRARMFGNRNFNNAIAQRFTSQFMKLSVFHPPQKEKSLTKTLAKWPNRRGIAPRSHCSHKRRPRAHRCSKPGNKPNVKVSCQMPPATRGKSLQQHPISTVYRHQAVHKNKNTAITTALYPPTRCASSTETSCDPTETSLHLSTGIFGCHLYPQIYVMKSSTCLPRSAS